jgi:hypothetical protein
MANAASLDAFRRAFVLSECGFPKRPDGKWSVIAALVLALVTVIFIAACR